MAQMRSKWLMTWVSCIAISEIVIFVLPNKYSGFIIVCLLPIGTIIGNSLLDKAVNRVDKKYKQKTGYRRMGLYNALIIFSKQSVINAGVDDFEDVIDYQKDYRLAMMFGGLFVFTGILYGISSAIFRMG